MFLRFCSFILLCTVFASSASAQDCFNQSLASVSDDNTISGYQPCTNSFLESFPNNQMEGCLVLRKNTTNVDCITCASGFINATCSGSLLESPSTECTICRSKVVMINLPSIFLLRLPSNTTIPLNASDNSSIPPVTSIPYFITSSSHSNMHEGGVWREMGLNAITLSFVLGYFVHQWI